MLLMTQAVLSSVCDGDHMTKKKPRVKKERSRIQWRILRHRLRRELKSAWPLLRLYLLFGLTLIFLFPVTLFKPVVNNVLDPFNSFLAWSTAATLSILGESQVVSSGTSVSGADFAFSIAAGCNGVYALVVVIAGMVAFPMSPRPKLVGLILAIVFVTVLNYIRILALWYTGNTSSFLFDITHTYLGEFVIIGSGAGFLYFWYERYVTKN